MKLVINFADVDYTCSLLEFGKYLTENIEQDVMTSMIEKGEHVEILSQLWRASLVLNTNRWDMYIEWSEAGRYANDMKRYTNEENDWFDFTEDMISWVEDFTPQEDDSNYEIVVIDFDNKISEMF